MAQLDSSQLEFCDSFDRNIRLLAPAGCGKTSSLLYRCRSLMDQGAGNPRFLIITFTNAAVEELKDRQAADPDFECLKDRVTINTLNAYGWRRVRNQLNNAQLLTDATKRYFAVLNQLRPIWNNKPAIEQAVKSRRGRNARTVLDVMDNLKSMGFDHTIDTSLANFQARIKDLEEQGASWRIADQFDTLAGINILEKYNRQNNERTPAEIKEFYDKFFTFWREATESLLGQSTFTFEDQKYWAYLDLKSPGADGKPKSHFYGAARYDHILVDEFQDINPLDLSLIKTVVERHQSTLTIVGDDDQAIYEWRGASPEFILQPQQYFGCQFKDYQLATNYRSPRNIVEHSQQLISNNQNRVVKSVKAAENAGTAEIYVQSMGSISERLRYVTDIVRDTEPGKVAVIGRRRGHLIPYEIYFASDGAPFKTAADLDIFNAKPLDDFTELLGVWARSTIRSRPAQAVNDALAICNLIKRFPLNKRDGPNLTRHLHGGRPRTAYDAVQSIANYTGTSLSGKSHSELHATAHEFITADNLKQAIEVIDNEFDGLSFDVDKQEESIWHTDPPLRQLAEIAESEGYDADDLIDRIETAKVQLREYQNLEDGNQEVSTGRVWERPLHLLTAHRAKGKEFDTVILLDTVQDVWPDYRSTDQREIEAERRLFYVAFTRAQRRVIMLTTAGVAISQFVDELNLPAGCFR